MRSFKDRRPRSGRAETTEAQDRIGVMGERKPEVLVFKEQKER